MPKIQYHWEINAYKLSVEAADEPASGFIGKSMNFPNRFPKKRDIA